MAVSDNNSDKQNLLANLYSLRAGISLACMYKNKADKIIRDAQNERAVLINGRQAELNGTNVKSAEARAEKQQAVERLKAVESELESNIGSEKRNKRERIKYTTIFALYVAALVAGVLLTAYCVFYFATGAGWLGNNHAEGSIVNILYGWMFIFGGEGSEPDRRYGIAGFLDVVDIVLILACVTGIVFWILYCGDIFSNMTYAIDKHDVVKYDIEKGQNERARLKAQIEQLNDLSERSQGESEMHSHDLARTKTETLELIKSAAAKATPYVEVAVALTAALDVAFTEYIDFRDWENLDYIIYCIETRRSDNMKEALAAVDRQRQTEQIVSAVEAAGREIGRTMNMAINRLGDRMVSCFKVVSAQLERQSRQLSAIGSKMDDIASAQNMSNALLTMQNATSMAMLGELNKISNATGYVASCISSI